MDKKMTLEAVRDEISSGEFAPTQETLDRWADAIDAELKARGEAVAIVGPDDVIWLKPEACEVDVLLYTAPPAPKIEVTVDFVRRVLKNYPKHHANGLFIPLGEAYLFCALEAALKETP